MSQPIVTTRLYEVEVPGPHPYFGDAFSVVRAEIVETPHQAFMVGRGRSHESTDARTFYLVQVSLVENDHLALVANPRVTYLGVGTLEDYAVLAGV